MTSCLLFCTRNPSEMESTLKGMNLLPMWIFFFFVFFVEQPLWRKAGKTILKESLSLKPI